FFYWTGARGVSVSGADAIDFKREHDYALLKLTPSRALLVQGSGYTAVVKYERGPICWLMCGTYESAGTAGDAISQKGDWLFWSPKIPGEVAVNLETGETITVQDPASRAELDAEGLSFDGALLNRERVFPKLKAVSVQNESCTIFTSAFLLLFGLMLLALPFVARNHKKRLAALTHPR
ncbi:MAG: hypothetical protein JNK04_25050, partial [Myxococcales bacterium]|nr:hypothetical protein [Myxococcales bacterium]